MKLAVDYLLVGTGAAPLLAAQRLQQRGDSVSILNPDIDFFLEGSELPLDLMGFETPTSDLSKRFSNNLPEQVYHDLIQEFPGALELWKAEDQNKSAKAFQVESAPWIRSRHRLWLLPERSPRIDQLETLYLRALDLGWKPKWLESVSLANWFPGFSGKANESHVIEKWVGFLGPRFGDVDVNRYRLGLLEYVREWLGRENIHHSAHILEIDSKGIRFQLPTGNPQTMVAHKGVLIFWTPKLERFLRELVKKNEPRALAEFEEAKRLQYWEEWDVISREPVDPSVVAHFDRIRVWSHGEGCPPAAGWNHVKLVRRSDGDSWVNQDSFQDLNHLMLRFLGWDKFTVRGMTPRSLYRWNTTHPIEVDCDGVRTLLVTACNGPLNWVANQVRSTIDGV